MGGITSIYIPGERVSPPAATTEFNFDLNLSSQAETGDTYTTSQKFFDSLGNEIPVTFTFTRAAADRTWTVTGSIPADTGTAVTFGGAASINIVFDENGAMTSPADNVTTALALTNGAATPLSATWAFEDSNGVSLGDITGYSSESSVSFSYQDGYPSGLLRGISVGEDGIVTASYSNGEMTPMYQIALADFPSYDGLTKMGSNLYAESLASGQALIGVAGSGRLGSVAPGSLEMSNVDLAEEFVKMITTQRAFQANSRVITSSDEILQELINIKR
jgi:flagellar hook protein FlgE